MSKWAIRFAKRLIGKYEPGYEYWVKLSDIHITPQFRRSIIKPAKYKRKWQFYHRNGYCESKIVLNKDFVLVNGYSSYKIFRTAEGEDCKVPVWFVG
ncbi:hypothetical protein FYJ38_00050 [Clostridium sp. WB02_MRS01]|uniref:hypothetical protein n=1 Tax=Clostridium sp. WB02_MRS01 TaxID=2605777 RepID=UPI0012B3EFA3|nr:hypothetical protein [Clostridium sp. WB02_MRS01]MSS07030.1 hypothetical protein [Clostridium sp. WB02_MRS01]